MLFVVRLKYGTCELATTRVNSDDRNRSFIESNIIINIQDANTIDGLHLATIYNSRGLIEGHRQ